MFAYRPRTTARSAGGVRLPGLFAMIATLAACVSAPSFPPRVSVAEVVENARCELYDAIGQNNTKYPWIKLWAAAFDFSFVVERDANVSTDTSYLVPITAGTFALGLRANLKQKARSTYVVKYKITKGLEKFEITKGFGKTESLNCSQRSPLQPRQLLNGEIGLRQWINEVLPQIARARIMNSTDDDVSAQKKERVFTGEIDSLSYTIEFVVTADGSLLPVWALAYPDKRQFKPGFNLTASEIVTHKLIVAMTPRTIPKEEPQDWSTILDKRIVKKKGDTEGKEVTVIVGRKVCLVENGDHKKCDVELHEGEVRAKLSDAENTLNEVKKRTNTFTDADKENIILDFKSKIPKSFKNIPTMEILKNRDKLNFMADDKNRQDVMELFDKIDEVAKAEELVKQRQEELKLVKQGGQQRQDAARKALERADRDAERETERRLDALIQQQVIRDSFRQ